MFQGLSWNASIDVHGSMNPLCMPVSGKVVNIIHHRGGGHPSLFSIVLCSDPFLNFSERNQSGHETRLFHQSSSANTFNATVKTAFPLHHWHTTKSILNCKAVVCVCVCGGGATMCASSYCKRTSKIYYLLWRKKRLSGYKHCYAYKNQVFEFGSLLATNSILEDKPP